MDIWVKNQKYVMPKGYAWEYHNPVAFEEAVERQKNGDVDAIERYYQTYRETVEQREERWEKQFVMQALNVENIKDFQQYKDDPKAFLKKMDAIGRIVGKHWDTPPPTIAGGQQKQNLDGSWSESYRPVRSMRLDAWLDNMKHLPDEPNEQQLAIAEEARKQRIEKFWDWMYDITDNFSRGNSVAKTVPGLGANQEQVKYRYDL